MSMSNFIGRKNIDMSMCVRAGKPPSQMVSDLTGALYHIQAATRALKRANVTIEKLVDIELQIEDMISDVKSK